jgi:ribosomal protein S18 acetylase RimI-like enzyme
VAASGSDDGQPGAVIEVVPLTRDFAVDICTWRYPPPYECYDMTGADPDELVDPGSGFFALLRNGDLIGFRSFGSDGRVPGWEYDEAALDTGGGLRPELTGRGLGKTVIANGLAFGRGRFGPAAFRVTVAAFNTRAVRTVTGLGFNRVGSFHASSTGAAFEVLVRPEV